MALWDRNWALFVIFLDGLKSLKNPYTRYLKSINCDALEKKRSWRGCAYGNGNEDCAGNMNSQETFKLKVR